MKRSNNSIEKKTGPSSINLPSEEQVEKFERLYGLLSHIASDMDGFAKKKPDGAMNKLKVKMINKILTQIKEFFISDPIVEFLEVLDEDVLPTNSDTVLILGQFKSTMEQFKGKYYGRDTTNMSILKYRWFTKENPPPIKTNFDL